ncbi:MAG: WecB/TagA/CpsF family glycosyltransferase [Gammaproteobacteria bacterium]
MRLERIRVLDVPVDPVTMDQAVERARQWLREGKQGNILAVNPEKIMTARDDSEVHGFLSSARLLIPDGIGVVTASRWLGLGRFERVSGADLMPKLCEMAANEGYPVFLYGASEEVNRKASEELCRRYDKLDIAGTSHGFVTEEQMPGLIKSINDSGAKLVFVALGSPRQERWMQSYMPQLDARVFQGVGGTFDVLSGEVRRAPKLIQSLNLEWLYRLLSNPRRLIRQTALPRFMFSVIRAKLTSRG